MSEVTPRSLRIISSVRRTESSLKEPANFSIPYDSGELDGRGMWHVWGMRGAYRVLVEKPEGKRWLGRPRHRWDIKTDLQDMRWGMNRTDMAHNRDRWFTLLNAARQLNCSCVSPLSLRGPYTLILTNCSIMITVCATCFVIRRYALRPQTVYTVSYDSHSKQRLLSREF
jgi:hypothetical protein